MGQVIDLYRLDFCETDLCRGCLDEISELGESSDRTAIYYPRNWQDFTLEDCMKIIDSYIRWYNERRIKVSHGGRSPIKYCQTLGLVPV